MRWAIILDILCIELLTHKTFFGEHKTDILQSLFSHLYQKLKP